MLFKILIFICTAAVSVQIAQSQPTQASAIKPLSVGDTIPVGQLLDESNQTIESPSILNGKWTVLVYFRGGWCPYCNAHLAGLQELTGFFKRNNIQMVAVSNEFPSENKKTKDNNQLTYALFTDQNLVWANKLGIAYLENGNWKLPVPAVFVIDKNNVLRYLYWNPNYRIRLEPADLKQELTLLLKK